MMQTRPTDRLFDAVEFAARYHRGQFRKGTRIPYLSHLLGVCKILAESDLHEDVLIGGLLHDVVEDTDASVDDVLKHFGERVAAIVHGTTEPEKLNKLPSREEKATWRHRKRHTIDFVLGNAETINDDVLAVSCADKLDNARALLHDLERQGAALWERFNAPKEDQKWYYESLAHAFIEQSKTRPLLAGIAADLQKTTTALFGDGKA